MLFFGGGDEYLAVLLFLSQSLSKEKKSISCCYLRGEEMDEEKNSRIQAWLLLCLHWLGVWGWVWGGGGVQLEYLPRLNQTI